MTDFEEKRHFTRMDADCEISFRQVDCQENHSGACLNISGSGILFLADRPLELGKAVEVHTFPQNRITPPLTAFVEIVRCTAQGDNQYQIAGTIKGIKSE